MTSSPVLVPVRVDAMVVNREVRRFVRTPRAYVNLQQMESPDQLDFPTAQDSFQGGFGLTSADRGIHLMWRLPVGLRRGIHDEDGKVTFPLVPNRWIVVRWGGPPGARTAKAWGIESDYLGTDGSSPFITADADGQPSPTRIGRHTELVAGKPWRPQNGGTPFLTAVGAADPTFSVYQPGMRDVFSFHDQFDDDAPGTYSYAVVGWYSTAAADVLNVPHLGATVGERLKCLNWRGDADSQPRSVFHGAAFEVEWRPMGDMQPRGRRDAKAAVAVANTGIDGLKALIQAANAEIDADLLEAFQHGLLDALNQPGADDLMETARRKAAFMSEPGGTVWTAVNKGTDETVAPTGALAPEQAADEAAVLTALNSGQTALAKASRELKTLQRELVEILWKYRFASANPGMVTVDTNALSQVLSDEDGSLPQQIAAVMARIKDLTGTVPSGATSEALARSISGFNARLSQTRELKAAPQPPFFTAMQPVLLVAGVNHAEDPFADTTVLCRTAGDVVSSVFVPAPAGKPSSLTLVATAPLLAAFDLSPAPDVAAILVKEAFLLDPANAGLFAEQVLETADAAAIQAVGNALRRPQPLSGTVAALWPQGWEQPWLPLFIDWEVDWYDLPFDQWRFDGTDYVWAGRGADSDWKAPLNTYSGRSLVAPQPAFVFTRRLRKFIADHPGLHEDAALATAADLAAGWDILTQSMAGLTDWIALRDPRATLAPDTAEEVLPGTGLTIADLVGDGAPHPPQSITPKPPHHGAVEPPYFSGLRAGQFTIVNLRVVDCFGQELMLRGEDVIDPAELIIAPDLRSDKTVIEQDAQDFVTLPPRLLQAGRLRFDFTHSGADGSVTPLLPGDDGNPVAGWILPNHFDEAIAAYTAQGTCLGELALNADRSAVIWLPAPGSPAATLAEVARLSPDLGATLAGLQAAGPAEWDAFRAVVDETLWTVEPLGARDDEVLQALVGRPLAVVRIALSLELSEDALWEPSWPSTFKDADPLLPKLAFPVRLGDLGRRADGLIGYFDGRDFSKFHSVHDPALSADRPGKFVEPITAETYPTLSFDAAPRPFTVLMDPRAAVGARTGLLPLAEIRIPDRFVTPALRDMVVSLRTGPVLTRFIKIRPKPDAEPVTAISLPAPASQAGTWRWSEGGQEVPLAGADRAPTFAGPPTLRDGFMRLTGGLSGKA